MITFIQKFRQHAWLLLSCLFLGTEVHAMVFDNRFVPLILQPFFTQNDARWNYSVRGIFFGSKETLNPDIASMEGDDIPLYELFGSYDELRLEQALQDAQVIQQPLFPPGMPLPGQLIWRQHGKLAFEGVVFETFLKLTNYLGIGGSMIGGKMDTHLELERVRGGNLPPGDKQIALDVNTQIHELLGLKPPCYDNGMFGNIDIYLRLHAVREYWNKFKRVDIGCNFGFLIPTGHATNIHNPAFVPLGNKHFGLYGALDSTFVLKDDYIVGLLFRVNKRFKHTECIRMPVLHNNNTALFEPLNYGVLVGPAQINPGWTFVFMPRFEMTGLRDGLGFNIAYVLTVHSQDTIRDRRTAEQIAATAPANTCIMEELSSWGSDYISAAVLYDFGYDKECARYAPVVSLIVDIPFKGLVSKRVFKTHGISLRIESRI